MIEPPKGYAEHPAWLAFELWVEANKLTLSSPAHVGLFWNCFLAGFEVGKIEGGV